MHVRPNSSWQYSQFHGTTVDELKAATGTTRFIGPIDSDTHKLFIFYSKRSPGEVNVLACDVANSLFRDRVWKIRGSVWVLKIDRDDLLMDVCFEDFYGLYLSYLASGRQNESFVRKFIRKLSKLFSRDKVKRHGS